MAEDRIRFVPSRSPLNHGTRHASMDGLPTEFTEDNCNGGYVSDGTSGNPAALPDRLIGMRVDK